MSKLPIREKPPKTHAMPTPIDGRVVISRKETARRLGVHLATTNRLQATVDGFPQPIQLSPNRVGFYEDEIEQWRASRPRVPTPVYVDPRKGKRTA